MTCTRIMLYINGFICYIFCYLSKSLDFYAGAKSELLYKNNKAKVLHLETFKRVCLTSPIIRWWCEGNGDDMKQSKYSVLCMKRVLMSIRKVVKDVEKKLASLSLKEKIENIMCIFFFTISFSLELPHNKMKRQDNYAIHISQPL